MNKIKRNFKKILCTYLVPFDFIHSYMVLFSINTFKWHTQSILRGCRKQDCWSAERNHGFFSEFYHRIITARKKPRYIFSCYICQFEETVVNWLDYTKSKDILVSLISFSFLIWGIQTLEKSSGWKVILRV